MNLISGAYHSCERREHAFMVLREYSIISPIAVALKETFFIFFFFCSSFTYQSIWFADFKNVSIVGHYVKDRTKDAQFIIIRYFLLKMIRYSRSIINADYFLSHEWWVPP